MPSKSIKATEYKKKVADKLLPTRFVLNISNSEKIDIYNCWMNLN